MANNYNCINCTSLSTFDRCATCDNGSRFEKKKMTNAERIKVMSDEELAEFICTHEVCKWDSDSTDIPDIINWLQSEAE